MDMFGPKWKDHAAKLQAGFAAVGPEDVTVLCGDSSWAMTLEDGLEDFRFIHALPGKKIILKGNHDYWWTSAAKMNTFFAQNGLTSLAILRNNAWPYGDGAAICGAKSLKAAGEREKYVFLHYPPKYGGYACRPILELLEKYEVRMCCSGHLHAESLRMAFNGWEGNTRHVCVSADGIDFRPCKIL